MKNNDIYKQKIQDSGSVESKDWVQKWNKFQSDQKANSNKIQEFEKKLASKSGLVAQTEVNYSHEKNKFILYTILNIVLGTGAVYVSLNLMYGD